MQKNNILFEKNIAIIKRRLIPLHDGLLKYIETRIEEGKVIIDESARGEKVVGVVRDNRCWYLNSRYDAENAVKCWADGVEEINFRGIVIMNGISNMMYAREMLKRLGKDNILVLFEPDPAILVKVIEETDVSDILEDDRVFIFANDINMTFFRQYFGILFEYDRINYSKILTLPNYGMLFPDEIGEFEELCEKELIAIHTDKNTYIHLGEEINDNHIDNIWSSIFSSSIDELKKTIDKTDIKGVPAIIVAAGPSLDKNIELVREAKGKALIVAVDSAIKAMMARDIIPDLLVTIDSHKPMSLFEDERIEYIPLVICMQSRVEILQKHKGKMFMSANMSYIKSIYRQLGTDLSVLSTGGSVANNAFSLVKFLGFKTIIFIGQDLAFTDNKKHVKNAYTETAVGEDESEEYIEIEDQNGDPILTFRNFKLYRDWFESEIRDNPDLHVINATEGGAKIHGTEIITFREAIDKYCNKNVDFNKLIELAADSFSAEQKLEYFEILMDMPNKLNKLKKRFEKGIRDYNRFYELLRKGKNGTSEFRHVLKSIEEVNNIDLKEQIMEFVVMYAMEDEYRLIEGIYDVEKSADIKSEGREIADRGISMLNSYIKACARVIERVEYVLENIVDENRIEMLKAEVESHKKEK